MGERLEATYSASGNIMGVFVLQASVYQHDDYLNDAKLRQSLAEWGQADDIDSVMVLGTDAETYQKQGVHFSMDVFEPWGTDDTGLAGTWSSMCGNGLIAVSKFFEDYVKPLDEGEQIHIKTRSGLRVCTKVGDDKYAVRMGEFTYRVNELADFVKLEPSQGKTEWFQEPIPGSLGLGFSRDWSIGFSGDLDQLVEGEPHVVMLSQEHPNMTIAQLKDIAIQEGPLVTRNEALFPHEASADFTVVQDNNTAKKELNVIGCTHEKGLGDDAERAVTAACGTGATAIAATLYRIYELDDGYRINVNMPGGLLQVYREQGEFYLIGQAKQLSKTSDIIAQSVKSIFSKM